MIPPISQVFHEAAVSTEDNRTREGHILLADALKYRKSWFVSGKSHTDVGFLDQEKETRQIFGPDCVY